MRVDLLSGQQADDRYAGAARVNWYMPRWLDRLLPHIGIEGAEFFRSRDRRRPVEPDRGREAVAGAVGS